MEACSQDLKDQVVRPCDAGGSTRRAIAQFFLVSQSFIREHCCGRWEIAIETRDAMIKAYTDRIEIVYGEMGLACHVGPDSSRS